MAINKRTFINNYVTAINESDAALFVGAGLSRPAGFVDWKGLLRECALELKLDIDREHDLIAVAQYYINRRSRDRSRLNQIIKDEFDKSGKHTINHEIISRLPVATVWTTNFDALLEEAYRKAGKNTDVKSRDQDIARSKKGREVIIYKMHGDITRPDEVIICKDDYERYAGKHKIFQNAIEGDLIQKTFLFLGFSFTDPNLEYMLGHLRTLLEDSKREHYAIMRRVSRKGYPAGPKGKKDYEYELNRQELQIEDLQRYSIQTVLIDAYEEITELLLEIEARVYQKNVFVSGSAEDFGAFGETKMKELCNQLGERLMGEGYNLVSGFGVGIGSSVIMGSLSKLYETKPTEIDKRLLLRPFPQKQLTGVKLEEFKRKYRESMITKCGFAVFIAGNKPGHKEAPGVVEEYEIARRLGKVPIPIGVTGFAARKIWTMVEADLNATFENRVSKSLFLKLSNASLDNTALLDAVFEIMHNVSA